MGDRHLAVSLRQEQEIPLDIDFTCGAGDVLAIFGPSGAGKTTILRSVAGLYRPARASVRSGGEIWADTTTGRWIPPHKRAVGFVFQDYALFPHLTALGNVLAALGHRPRSERRQRAEALLDTVHLSNQGRRRPHELSGGERQRVAVARALAREPSVLLLDEPFAAVDRVVRRRLQDEIDDLRRTLGIPSVLVTHDFDDVVRLATHLLIVEGGRRVASGPVPELMSRPDLPILSDLVGPGCVFEAVVSKADASRGLLELAFDGGSLLVPSRDVPVGASVRVRIPAREVILSSTNPVGLSLHNALAGTVSAIHSEPGGDQAVVQVVVGGVRFLAEVTRDALQRLDIAVGRPLHALIKSVSIEVRSAPALASRGRGSSP